MCTQGLLAERGDVRVCAHRPVTLRVAWQHGPNDPTSRLARHQDRKQPPSPDVRRRSFVQRRALSPQAPVFLEPIRYHEERMGESRSLPCPLTFFVAGTVLAQLVLAASREVQQRVPGPRVSILAPLA